MAKVLAYRSAQRLAEEMNSRAPRLLQTTFDQAMAKWKIRDVVNWEQADYDKTSYEYTPETREMSFSDATPMTCESNPSFPSTNSITPIKGFCTKWELGAKICGLNCGDENINDLLEKQLMANSMGFGKLYWEQFLFGAEVLGYYGIVNHPLAAWGPVTITPGGDPVDLCDLTVNQLIDLFIADTYGMEQPKILLGLDCYRKVMHKQIGCDGGTCKTMIQCLAEVLAGMPDVNFTVNDIMATEMLDGQSVFKLNSNLYHPIPSYTNSDGDVVDITNDSLYIAFDAAVTRLEASRPVWIDAVPTGNAKQAKGISSVNSCGYIIEQTNSVVVRHMICCPNIVGD